MNGRERIQAVMRGEWPDRRPALSQLLVAGDPADDHERVPVIAEVFPELLEALHHGWASSKSFSALATRSSWVPRRLRYSESPSTAGPSDSNRGS